MQRTAAASRRSAEARIKLLCCLGLRSRSDHAGAAARVCTASSHRTAMRSLWADETGEIAYPLKSRGPEAPAPTVVPLYLQEFHNRPESVLGNFTWSMRHESGVHTLEALGVEKTAFYRSNYYNVIMRPMGWSDFLRLPIRDGARGLGGLQIIRAPDDPPFTAEEQGRLARLEPFHRPRLARARRSRRAPHRRRRQRPHPRRSRGQAALFVCRGPPPPDPRQSRHDRTRGSGSGATRSCRLRWCASAGRSPTCSPARPGAAAPLPATQPVGRVRLPRLFA